MNMFELVASATRAEPVVTKYLARLLRAERAFFEAFWTLLTGDLAWPTPTSPNATIENEVPLFRMGTRTSSRGSGSTSWSEMLRPRVIPRARS